jgi:hypothetical protein
MVGRRNKLDVRREKKVSATEDARKIVRAKRIATWAGFQQDAGSQRTFGDSVEPRISPTSLGVINTSTQVS